MAGIIDAELPTYNVNEIRSLRDVKRIFPDGYEAKNNWLFLSMQGEHGTHLTIEDVEDKIHSQDQSDKYWITVLVVQPRLCNLFYGEIQVGLKDLPFLRRVVKNTLEVIPKTQKGNT